MSESAALSENLPIHPGFLDFEHPPVKTVFGEKPFWQIQREERKFIDFIPFIATAGYSVEDRNVFVSYLQELYESTSDLWEPGACRRMPFLVDRARDIIKDYKNSGYVKVDPKRFGYGHFWLRLETKNDQGKILIIDPTGVPVDSRNHDRRQILPYFGPPDSVKGYAGTVYSRAEDIDDWGYGDLPRGFHP